MSNTQEKERAAYLLDAQDKAASMFEEIGNRLIRPGVLESTINQEILDLGAKRHNVRTHWHKRVIRSGPNTLKPYAEDPPGTYAVLLSATECSHLAARPHD